MSMDRKELVEDLKRMLARAEDEREDTSHLEELLKEAEGKGERNRKSER